MMPRVIILAGKLHPYGGIETHLFHFCLSLAAFAEITLVITSKAYAKKSQIALSSRGITILQFDCGVGFLGGLEYLRCLRWLHGQKRREYILYSNGTSGFAYLANLALRPTLWVHHHHGDITLRICREFSRLYKKVLENTDWLIACTSGHAQILDEQFRRCRRTVFLPILKTEPKENVGFAPRPTGNVNTVVGFFGRLRESKGVLTLISLASWFVDMRMECRLHGDNCESLISPPLPPGISWFGAYDSSRDLDALLSDIDVVTLPTTFEEGLPIVVSEAISRGVPVVAYPGGGLREMRDFHLGLMIVPPNVDALKSGLLEMRERLRHPYLREGLAKKYREQLSNDLTVGWWADLLSKVSH
jgi:glycosyltransferase involved in cell wall biosynthesis